MSHLDTTTGTPPKPLTGFWKWFYICLGFLMLGFAYIGWLLPGIPCSPFVVLASLCFSRSSPRLEAWLLNNKFFGAYLRDLKEHGGIRRTVKIRATFIVVCVVSVSVLILVLTDRPWYCWAFIPPIAGIGLMVLWFCLRTLPDALSEPTLAKQIQNPPAAQRSFLSQQTLQ
jgi:uncharacterized membrane protein YbaN (DUF454 family)